MVMSSVATADSFLELLRKSELLDPKQLARARDAARDADGARPLAKALVREGMLTRWQAGGLLQGRSLFSVG